MKPPSRLFCFALSFSAILCGCQAPAYKLPGGFSSSYSRALQNEQILVTPQGDVREPVIRSDGVFYPQSFRFDPPTKSAFEQAVLVPPNPTTTRRR